MTAIRPDDSTEVRDPQRPARLLRAAPAALRTSPATLMRLFAGRPTDPADYQLTGAVAVAGELVVFS